MTFFSDMDEKSDIDIKLSKCVVSKKKQGIYGSKEYLHYLDLSSAHFNHKFGVASHFISSCDGITDTGNQTNHHNIHFSSIENHGLHSCDTINTLRKYLSS